MWAEGGGGGGGGGERYSIHQEQDIKRAREHARRAGALACARAALNNHEGYYGYIWVLVLHVIISTVDGT